MSENEPKGETVTVPKEQYDEMVEKLADATQSKSNLVNEVTELRKKNQITESEKADLLKQIEASTVQPTGDLDSTKVAELAEQAAKRILSERDSKTAEDNKKAAFAEFLEKHKEFHPDNDEGGLKFSSVERKLSRFNLSGMTSKEDFMSALEDARNLAVGGSQPSKEEGRDPNPLPPAGGNGTTTVREAQSTSLSPKELAIVDRTFGGDKERYLKIKEKRPDYVATLLQYST